MKKNSSMAPLRRISIRKLILCAAALSILVCADPPSVAAAKPKRPGNRPHISKPRKAAPISDARSSLKRSLPPETSDVSTIARDPIFVSEGRVELKQTPTFASIFNGKFAARTTNDDIALYSVDPEFQDFVEGLVDRVDSPHVAVVAMQPSTGRILAIFGKSTTIQDIAFHAGFPAASLFKVVTSAAAVDQGVIGADSVIAFRGGTYSLNQWNYIPNQKKDRRSMSVAEALGKSCNPVFGRIAYRFLNSRVLNFYANSFGFNLPFGSDVPIPTSPAVIPNDRYELSRTAAGFGAVKISPVHAAAIAAAVGNGGLLPRPFLIEKVVSPEGQTVYEKKLQALKRIARESTTKVVSEMMVQTTLTGTSRKEFNQKNRPALPGISVAAKTGTLKGQNPSGLTNWFIASAPSVNPVISLAVVVVDDGRMMTKASRIGRMVLQEYFRNS